ncbi:unnamed protein product [Paramecium sonneborni]|uniref:MORN repeat protein n=1 Tax=Paramecium sonneborni TaxID=65129 RepID=A0A8S1RRS5_9CILI|nr:unnamed protein product [Paramecium sonneborni]
MKVGRWDIMYCQYNEKEYKQIGGGSYDKEGNQNKMGKWIEIYEGFTDCNTTSKKVTYNGEYNMNGMKVGRWDIMYCKYNEIEYKQIGGGLYDQEGNQKKIGNWEELYEKFEYYSQITYDGEYNLNGMKVGRWDIMYCQYNEKEYKQMQIIYSGGGSYDKEGNQNKMGKWIEIYEGFTDCNTTSKKVTYNGEYNMNGMKVGRWDIIYYKYNEIEYQQIGGGSYDQEGNQKKIRKWVELDEAFCSDKQIIYNGEYNMNGMKVDRWDIINLKYQQILW